MTSPEDFEKFNDLHDLIIFEKVGKKQKARYGDWYIDHTRGNCILRWTRKDWSSEIEYEIVREVSREQLYAWLRDFEKRKQG